MVSNAILDLSRMNRYILYSDYRNLLLTNILDIQAKVRDNMGRDKFTPIEFVVR